MKYYSINGNDRSSYILSYKIIDGKIITKYANGDCCSITYNKKNENMILSKMEEQARRAEVMPLSDNEKRLPLSPWILILTVFNFINFGGLLYLIVMILSFGCTAAFIISHIIYKIRKDDIKRLKLFLNNKDMLNDNIKNNDDVLINTSKKMVKQIKLRKCQGKVIFNINNIDTYSLKDLIILRNNIQSVYLSDFKYNDVLDNDLDEIQDSSFKKSLTLRKNKNY